MSSIKIDWGALLAPMIVALAEALIKAFLKWIETWEDPNTQIDLIGKVAQAAEIFHNSPKQMNDYLNLRRKLGEIPLA